MLKCNHPYEDCREDDPHGCYCGCAACTPAAAGSTDDLNQRIDQRMAVQLESTGNLVSDLGEHGLANQLWSLGAQLRRRSEGEV